MFEVYLPDTILKRLLGAIPTSYNESSHTSIQNKVNKKRFLGPKSYEAAVHRGGLEYQLGTLHVLACFLLCLNFIV